ncbi:Ig-like domain-containing protein [Neobacillus sp.]|uniref:Ig-like domain-containing protein n=1 Tax=Neobacillus sp. TaxID=2675273 RepID=UPI00289D0384|nr:Ig-like domain-containing protein [Neobacillus sp.]
MKQSGSLHKTKLQVLILLVLCFQFLGSIRFFPVLTVQGEELNGTEPAVTITTPKTGDILNAKTITISGTIENFAAGVSVDLYNGTEKIGTTNDIVGNSWTINVVLPDGTYGIYAKATDSEGKTAITNTINLSIDTTPPNITLTKPIVLSEIYPSQDMTQVSLNTTIKIKVLDVNGLNEQKINDSIHLSTNGTNVPGTFYYDSKTKEIIFTPETPLTPNTKYNVIISPLGVMDVAGNMAFPKVWSFTTVSTPLKTHQNPHGNYGNNVNICGNCHSTHEANDPNLLSAKTTTDAGQNEKVAVDNYCMACHDGTVAPMPENSQSTHTHKAAVKIDGKPSGSSCSSCHNPHLDWSEKNPNLLQDHITYKHLPPDSSDPDQVKPTGEISSKEQLCESCHESDSAEKIANPAVEYRLFQYNKSNTAVGIYEDYELCLRCHNSNFQKKYEQTPDIASYYNNLTEEIKKQYENDNGQSSFSNREISAEEKNFSGHIIKAQDGSPLAGHIPCAECHDTHGSDNIKNLKTQLGHENPTAFEAKTGEWDLTKERAFCVTCHNGKTAIYGVTGKAIYDETTGMAIDDPTNTGHNKNSDKACSKCHSDSADENKAFIEAAHGPKKGKN